MSLPEKIAAALMGAALLFAFVGFCVYTWLCHRQRRRAEESRRERLAEHEAWKAKKTAYREQPLQEVMQKASEAADKKEPFTPQVVTYEKGEVRVEDRPHPHPLANVYGGDVTIIDDGSGPHGEDVNIEGARRPPYANRNPVTAAEPHAMSPAELEARIRGSKLHYRQISDEAEKTEQQLRSMGGERAVEAGRKKAFDPEKDEHWQGLMKPDSPAFRFDDPTKTE
jgi:hypothetical protein